MPDSRDTPEINGDDPPPLRLDFDEQPELEHDGQPVDWRRVATMLGVVVATAVATALVTDARHETQLDEIAASEINLVAGTARDLPSAANGESYIVSEVSLFNAGPRAIEVSAVHIPGREISDQLDARPWTLESGEWQVVEAGSVPDCAESDVMPEYVEVTASAEVNDTTVRTKLPVRSATFIRHGGLICPVDNRAPAQVHVADISVGVPSSGELPVLARLEANPPGLLMPDPAEPTELRVTGVETTTPGLAVKTDNLPQKLTVGSSGTLGLLWSVTDCDQARTFNNVEFSVEWTADESSGPASRSSRFGELPNEALVAITRFVADRCAS